MYANILVPIDIRDEKTWRMGLPAALQLARKTGARIHVVTVISDYLMTGDYPNMAIDSIISEAKDKLQKIVNQNEAADIRVTVGVEQGSITAEVLRVARELPADLIVMTSHRPQLKDYVMGSTAGHIVLHASCSVHVVREGGERHAEVFMAQDITKKPNAA
jgi:nucleotide-binding universal stress UspA family protein